MSSTSIVNGDVMRCGRAPICQGTRKYTGVSWTYQRGSRPKRIICTTCGKQSMHGIKVGGRGSASMPSAACESSDMLSAERHS
jgi:hypothetical protein